MKFLYAITYPATIDTLSNPASGDALNNVTTPHATQHADANDAIEALEAKVGADSSAVNTSHDYKLSGVATGDKAVSKTGTETLTNKTLTSPVINLGTNATGDIYYRDSGGAFQRLPIGTSGQILQVSSGGIPEYIANPSATDASATVKGVVEIATAAEITAGTATGGTGAKLAISPDQLALSTPTFSGANLTSLPVSSYVSAVTTNSTTSTTQNIDTTFTTGFLPKTITLYFKLQGLDNTVQKYTEGIATFDGTTLTGALTFARNQLATAQFTYTLSDISNTALTAGTNGGGTNYVFVTLSVLSVSATGFVVRTAYISGGNPGAASYYAVATR